MTDVSRSDLTWMRMIAISNFYMHYLGRFPDPDGFSDYISNSIPLDEIRGAILDSEEYNNLESSIINIKKILDRYETKKKIILLGAYGNGNLGDKEMAIATASFLERDQNVVCFAHSDLNIQDYPFPIERKLASGLPVLNARVLSLFDGLVIGGGGLLAYPHYPIWTTEWAHLLSVPYGILGCGVGVPLPKPLHPLVSGAAVVSARDPGGVMELGRFNSDAMFIPDLLLATCPMLPPAPPSSAGPTRRLFVLRAPAAMWHEDLRQTMGPHDHVALFEREQDTALIDMFPGCSIVEDAETFRELMRDYDLIVSERYHGAILALLEGRSVAGVWRDDHNGSKIVQLFDALGLGDKCHDISSVPARLEAYDTAAAQQRLAEQRERADNARPLFLSRLFRGNKQGAITRYVEAPQLTEQLQLSRTLAALQSANGQILEALAADRKFLDHALEAERELHSVLRAEVSRLSVAYEEARASAAKDREKASREIEKLGDYLQYQSSMIISMRSHIDHLHRNGESLKTIIDNNDELSRLNSSNLELISNLERSIRLYEREIYDLKSDLSKRMFINSFLLIKEREFDRTFFGKISRIVGTKPKIDDRIISMIFEKLNFSSTIPLDFVSGKIDPILSTSDGEQMTMKAADSVDRLLELKGHRFVDAAYMALLGRAPDSAGRAFYYTRLEAGHGKALVLYELARSQEAQAAGLHLEGLDSLIYARRRENKWWNRLTAPRPWLKKHLNRIEFMIEILADQQEQLTETLRLARIEQGDVGSSPAISPGLSSDSRTDLDLPPPVRYVLQRLAQPNP